MAQANSRERLGSRKRSIGCVLSFLLVVASATVTYRLMRLDYGGREERLTKFLDWLVTADLDEDVLIFSSMIDADVYVKPTAVYNYESDNGTAYMLSAFVEAKTRSAYIYTKNGRAFGICVFDHRPRAKMQQWLVLDAEEILGFYDLVRAQPVVSAAVGNINPPAQIENATAPSEPDGRGGPGGDPTTDDGG
ncbi:MAG: hypothetical protein ACI89L_001138 [Phycisphaerales bacterium]|jgi:hypothetical protein